MPFARSASSHLLVADAGQRARDSERSRCSRVTLTDQNPHTARVHRSEGEVRQQTLALVLQRRSAALAPALGTDDQSGGPQSLETKDCDNRCLLAVTRLRQHADANTRRNSEPVLTTFPELEARIPSAPSVHKCAPKNHGSPSTKSSRRRCAMLCKIVETALCDIAFGCHHCSSHWAARTLQPFDKAIWSIAASASATRPHISSCDL
jgi:hypothetical protein